MILERIEDECTKAMMDFKRIRLVVLGNKEYKQWLKEAKNHTIMKLSKKERKEYRETTSGSVRIVLDSSIKTGFEVYY